MCLIEDWCGRQKDITHTARDLDLQSTRMRSGRMPPGTKFATVGVVQFQRRRSSDYYALIVILFSWRVLCYSLSYASHSFGSIARVLRTYWHILLLCNRSTKTYPWLSSFVQDMTKYQMWRACIRERIHITNSPKGELCTHAGGRRARQAWRRNTN